MHKRRLIKVLGPSMLAILAVMATSASAARANYALLLNGNPVSSIEVAVEFLNGWVKTESGLKIQCDPLTAA